MSVARFHVEHLSAGDLVLSRSESDHARKARRLKPGDPVILFDGQGYDAEGRIQAAEPRCVVVRAESVRFRPRPRPELTLAVALPKAHRQDVLVEKCTELGVRAIWPIQTERSVASASPHKREKWQRTMIEAAKQSGNSWVPEVAPPGRLSDVVDRLSDFDRCFLATTEPLVPERLHIDQALDTDARSLLFCIGPEGGWSDNECQALASRGVVAIDLGPNVLRIETAAIAVAALVHARQRSSEADDDLPEA